MQIVWKSTIDKKVNTAFEIHSKNFAMLRSDKVIEGERFIPSVVGANNPKDELICLLKLAAEIEQTLLIQYLYTAYSISDDSSFAKQRIIKVAIQEMGHLLAVQNLLLSVGGIENLHLHKSKISSETEFRLLPYTLEPLSKTLIAKYVAVEAPIVIPDDLIDEVKKISEIAFENAGVSFNPVGGLYEKIFWIFQRDDNPVPNMIQLSADENFPAGWHIIENDFISQGDLIRFESDLQHWKLGPMKSSMRSNQVIFSQIHMRLEALQLVNDVAVQGERSDLSDGVESHFEIFLEIFREFNQAQPPIINAPTNPITRANSEFKNSTEIKNEYTLIWCELFNKLYTSLLMDIFNSIYYKQFDATVPLKFVKLIRSNMTDCINKLFTDVIIKLPLHNNGFSFNVEPLAAPTFEIDESFALLTKKDEVDKINSDLTSDIQSLISKISMHSDFTIHKLKDTSVEQTLTDINDQYCIIKSQLLKPTII